MPHALDADQQICQVLHFLRFTPQQDYFEAIVSIQMCMEGRYDDAVMCVLEVGELFR